MFLIVTNDKDFERTSKWSSLEWVYLIEIKLGKTNGFETIEIKINILYLVLLFMHLPIIFYSNFYIYYQSKNLDDK